MKSPTNIWPRSSGGIENDSGDAPNTMRKPLLDHHRQPEGQQQAQDRIGAVEAAKQQPLDDDAEAADDDRRGDECAGKADAVRQDDREIGADGVEAAMREIDDAAEREDQREAERDQQVIGADQQSVENLLEEEDELHAGDPALKVGRHSGA